MSLDGKVCLFHWEEVLLPVYSSPFLAQSVLSLLFLKKRSGEVCTNCQEGERSRGSESEKKVIFFLQVSVKHYSVHMKEMGVGCKHKPVDNCQFPHVLEEINVNCFSKLIHCVSVPGQSESLS